MLTQEIKLSKAITTVTKRQNQTLENVLMKMNQKLGGLNNVILMDDKTIRYRTLLSIQSERLDIGFLIPRNSSLDLNSATLLHYQSGRLNAARLTMFSTVNLPKDNFLDT